MRLLVVLAAFGFILLRMGIMPAIVAIFVVNAAGAMPVSSEPASWFTPVTLVYVMVIASIALYGFVRSQAQARATG